MNKIKSALNRLFSQLKGSIQRFPESIMVAMIMVVVAILTNHDFFKDQEFLERILMVLVIALPLFAVVKLILERKLLSIKWRTLVDLVLVVLLAGFYWLIPEHISQQFIMCLLISMVVLYMIFCLAPYFYQRKYFATYCIHLASSFLVTYLYTLVLYLGLIAIIFTVDQLFDLHIDHEIYFDLLFVAIGIFGVTHFLGKVPQIDEEMQVESFPIVFKVLIVSIMMPLITAYTVVLYAYFAKMLISWEWPEGLVGQLVVWYGLISIIILFSIQDLGENSHWITTFKRFFPFAFILPLIMMFCAIGIRISQNGWTLPRYYVVLVGVWLAIMAGYYIVKKYTQSTFALLSAIILLLISVYGPVNGFAVSIRSQSGRLEDLLIENNMIVAGEVVKREDLGVEQKAKITNIIYYLNSLEAVDEVTFLPTDFDLAEMKTVFGFESEYDYYRPDADRISFGYYYQPINIISPVAGYHYMIDFEVYGYNETELSDENITFTASIKEDQIEITLNNQMIATQSIQDIARTLYARLGNRQDLNKEDLTYTIENEKATVVIYLTNIYGTIDGDEFLVESMNGAAWVTVQ